MKEWKERKKGKGNGWREKKGLIKRTRRILGKKEEWKKGENNKDLIQKKKQDKKETTKEKKKGKKKWRIN